MENKKIKLELSLEEVNVVLSGLGELPAKLTMPLINNIHKVATEQMSQKEEVPSSEQ